MVTDDAYQLSRRARTSVEDFAKAGLEVPEIPYESLSPVVFHSFGEPVDMQDAGGRKAQDLLKLSVVDGSGSRRIITVSEYSILEGIAQGSYEWQDPSSASRTTRFSAKPMYTAFVHEHGVARDQALALLFKPTLEGQTNQHDFHVFVEQVLDSLIALEELQQDPSQRKGYIEAAKKASKKPGGLLKYLFTDPNEQPKPGEKKKNFTEKVLQFLEDARLLSREAEYNLNQMDLPDLLKLSSGMFEIADSYFGPQKRPFSR